MTGFDALLLVSFGGPEGPDDVVPFLRNVTRGRGIPEERLRVVGQHYFHFGGVSPINGQNRELLQAVRQQLAADGLSLPVYWGNRNWAPYLTEAMQQMVDDGVRRALVFFTSAYSSYSGCRQYRENLADALEHVGDGAPAIERLGPYYAHEGFLAPFVDTTVASLEQLDDEVRAGAHLVFTTHSLPQSMADTSGPSGGAYVAQHRQAAAWVAGQVAERTGVDRPWELVFQSRSGPPGQAWLEPDVGDHVVALQAAGASGVVVVPIGFVSDHMEVLWDLDTQARQQAAEVGLPYVRAATPGTDPGFVAMVSELVRERVDDVPVDSRRRVSGLSAAPDRCAAGCCPNPRAPRPAACGSD